jgi:hypothetical protein
MKTIAITCEERRIPQLGSDPVYIARFRLDGIDYNSDRWQPTAQIAKDRAMADLVRRTSRIGL